MVHHRRKSEEEPGKILGAGPEAEVIERSCLLVCATQLAQPAFLHNPRSPSQRCHSKLGPPTSISSQENAPQTYLQARKIETIP